MVAIRSTTFSILERLRRKAAKAAGNNAVSLAELGAPSVTVNTVAQMSNRQLTIGANLSLFRVIGGFINPSSGRIVANTIHNRTASVAVEFMHSGSSLEIKSLGSTTKFRILVNDRYISKAGHDYATTSNSSSSFAQIDFGSTAIRKIRFEFEQNGGFQGVNLPDNQSTIWPVDSDDRIRAAIVGDSYIDSQVATLRGDGLAAQAAHLLGWDDPWFLGMPGTGFTIAGSYATYIDRLPDLVASAPDVVLVWGSYNDRTTATASVQAAVTTYLTAVRNALPTVPILVTGCPAAATGPSAQVVGVDAAIGAGVAAANDPFAAFIPVSPVQSTMPSWVFGTGRVGTTAGNGNSDIYTAADGVHPPDAGHAYYARRLDMAVRAAVQSL